MVVMFDSQPVLHAARRVVGVITIALIASSCGGSSDDTTSSTSTEPATTTTDGIEVPVGATLHATVHFEGAVALDGEYDVEHRSSDPERNSCDGLTDANNPNGLFVVPFPSILGGYHIAATATASPYAGAGEYGVDDLPGLQVAPEDAAGTTSDFHLAPPTTATLTVAADASGTFTFAGLTTDTGQLLSGTVQWTCS